MEPTLHHIYTVADAIAAFGSETPPEFFLRDSFIVIGNAILCLETIGDSSIHSQLPSPSCFIWKRPDRRTRLPERVTEIYDRRGPKAEKIGQHYVFVRMPGNDAFCYLGQAHLGSYGYDGSEFSAAFELELKLPREIWLRYGGYPGWSIEVDHGAHRVDNDDLPTFRNLIETLLRKKFAHLCMTRYEEDSLTLHTNKRRGFLMYLKEPADSGLYARDSDYVGDLEAKEFFRCACGIDLEFPAQSTLPRDTGMGIAEEFFVTGSLSINIPWATDPSA